MIAEVIINSKVKTLNKKFDYKVPKEIEDLICVGSRVLVPFGKYKELEEGYVIKLKDKSDFELKEIAEFDENISMEKIELARWMARNYFCNVSECIKLMITPGMRDKKKEKRVTDKIQNFIYLNFEKEKIDLNNIKGKKQREILDFLLKKDGLTYSEIMKNVNVSRGVIDQLVKKGYIKICRHKIERNPLERKKIEKSNKLNLNDEQQYAYDKICSAINKNLFKQFLLYGVTGSGKTEVYMQLIEKVLENGKNAILLVPEISLTPQMINRFIARFGKDELAVLHSKLSIGERHDEWVKIQEKKAKIVIGARSAIFAPMDNIGIIIIDEEHDLSYKSESSPRYNAKEIAQKISEINKNVLVLGSATPDINTFYKTQNGEIDILRLEKRANSSSLPKVEIVDLKNELAIGNRTMISNLLYNLILENLKNKRQTILFLNRRGFSTFIMCRECGLTLMCPNCNICLTYHSHENKLKCHYCGYERLPVNICPKCKSDKIRYFGTGTQKLEQEVKRLFKGVTTIRMDVDTVNKKNSHEEILNKFKNENIDILIGTQMVVKGHHFPNVTLVGVIAADASLNIDDFRANERTFQILTQVAGRAGRENLEGRVVIQTYNPDNFCIELAQKQDYDLFYNTEIELRKQLNYPPFCDIIVFGFSGTNEKEVIELSKFMQNILSTNLKKYGISVFLALPAPIDKINSKFRWRIIAKGIVSDDIIIIINKCLKKIYDLNKFKNTNISVDINPSNMY